MTFWFTADYHLGHANIIKYCNRPFKNTTEMDTAIIGNLVASIKPGDTLHYLGDLAFTPDLAKEFVALTKHVTVHFIPGNHDKKSLPVIIAAGIHVSPLEDITVNGQKITLCHYAMRVWNESHLNAWQLYGHSHGTLPPVGKQWDVGVDGNGFKPVSFEQLVSIMKGRPDNGNYIPPEKRC
jgi:calcineurin-like phosphoesterase family protein